MAILWFQIFACSARLARFDVASVRPKSANVAAIVFSSDTTGKPKGIMNSQKRLLEAAKGYNIPKAFHWIDATTAGPTGKPFRRALREYRQEFASFRRSRDDVDLL